MKKDCDRRVSAIVLAAGKSTRIKSSIPKVLMDLGGRPLISYVLESLHAQKEVREVIIVLGHKRDVIKEAVEKEFKEVKFVVQEEPDGTAKAVEAALAKVTEPNVLITCADIPLVKEATLSGFIKFFFDKEGHGALITAFMDSENDLGRVVREQGGRIERVVEKQDLTDDIKEVNSGIYCFRTGSLKQWLTAIELNPKKKEYFFTDIIGVFVKNGLKIFPYPIGDCGEILGINTQSSLAQAYKLLNRRWIEELMSQGVRVISPDTTFLSWGVKSGRDSVIYPFTFIGKNVIIGNHCSIGPFVHIRANTVIKDNFVYKREGGNG